MNRFCDNNPMANELLQCRVCGFLENGMVEARPCPGRKAHDLAPLSRTTLASSLGRTGGRPKTYLTEADRLKARRETYNRANQKRRGKATSVDVL